MKEHWLQSLLLVLLCIAVLLLGSSSSTLALDATSAATTVWRSKGKVDVLLGVKTNNERWNVDDLLADTDNRCVRERRDNMLLQRTGYVFA